MDCPVPNLAFNVIEHPWLTFIGAVYMRDWKQTFAWWAIFQVPTTMAFLHLHEPPSNDIVLLIIIPFLALLGALLGELVSYFGPFPRLFDNRGIRDAYFRMLNWEPTAIGIGAIFVYWAVAAWGGQLSGPCTLGITEDQQLALAIATSVVGFLLILVPVVFAVSGTIVKDKMDRIDRRLNLKYLLIMAVRMALHFAYDIGAIDGFSPLYPLIYIGMIPLYWIAAYLYIGYINVLHGTNADFLVHRRHFRSYQDRWASKAQATYFVVSVAIIDISSNAIFVTVDQLVPKNVLAVSLAAVVVLILWGLAANFFLETCARRFNINRTELKLVSLLTEREHQDIGKMSQAGQALLKQDI